MNSIIMGIGGCCRVIIVGISSVGWLPGVMMVKSGSGSPSSTKPHSHLRILRRFGQMKIRVLMMMMLMMMIEATEVRRALHSGNRKARRVLIRGIGGV